MPYMIVFDVDGREVAVSARDAIEAFVLLRTYEVNGHVAVRISAVESGRPVEPAELRRRAAAQPRRK